MSAKTPLFKWHQDQGGRLIDFAGWTLPVHYRGGILAEHLACRKFGALFDISHMGRFLIRGPRRLDFLGRVLTNDAAGLALGRAHYTILADEQGRCVDDAFLYHFKEGEHLLVVNAANKDKDWAWLNDRLEAGAELIDLSQELAMIALQGPLSQEVLAEFLEQPLDLRRRNDAGALQARGQEILVARTGYTGELVGFELFLPWGQCEAVWTRLHHIGAGQGLVAAGLGARDTLRLEAALPLYGHELNDDMPVMALPQARFAVSLQDGRTDFIGREALATQAADLAEGQGRLAPKRIMALAATAKAMIRDGDEVLVKERLVGRLTSATTVPSWRFEGDEPGPESFIRALGLGYLEAELSPGQEVVVVHRQKSVPGRIVKGHLAPSPPFVRPLLAGEA